MAKENSISQQAILFGIIGFLLGLVLVLFFARSAVNNNNTDMMRMMGMHQNQQMMEEQEETHNEHMMMDESMSMDEMINELTGKSGDEFDKAFIDEMIDHHQGAIEMANLAKTSAKHQEIKDLADDIISAQTNEIEMMRKWLQLWGY